MAGNCDIVWYCSEIQRKYGVPSNIGCIIFSFFFHFAANSENFKCIRVQMNVQSLTLINMGWSIKKNIKQKKYILSKIATTWSIVKRFWETIITKQHMLKITRQTFTLLTHGYTSRISIYYTRSSRWRPYEELTRRNKRNICDTWICHKRSWLTYLLNLSKWPENPDPGFESRLTFFTMYNIFLY